MPHRDLRSSQSQPQFMKHFPMTAAVYLLSEIGVQYARKGVLERLTQEQRVIHIAAGKRECAFKASYV